MIQQSFSLPRSGRRTEHGGSIELGRRKEARPFDPKKPLHVVLRSSRAKNAWSFLKPMNKIRIEFLVDSVAKRAGVRVYEFSNVGNHLHILIRARSRSDLQRFLRILSGQIVFLVTNARKGNPVGRFWDRLAYSRVVTWGREYKNLLGYLVRNKLEALGAIDRYGRDRMLKIVPVVWGDPRYQRGAI